MQKRRFGAVVATTAVTLALSACGSSSSSGGGSGTSAGGGGGKPYIAIVSKGFQHQFWQAVKKGAEQEAKKDGATISFEGPPTEADVEAQINMLTNVLTKKPSAIGFAALDSKAAAPLLEQAKTAKIPVIAFDSGVDRQQGRGGRGCQAHVRGPWGQGQGRAGRSRPDQPLRHRPS